MIHSISEIIDNIHWGTFDRQVTLLHEIEATVGPGLDDEARADLSGLCDFLSFLYAARDNP